MNDDELIQCGSSLSSAAADNHLGSTGEDLPEVTSLGDLKTPPLTADDPISNGRLFVRNLSYDTEESELQELFARFGPVDDVSSAAFSESQSVSMMISDRDKLCTAHDLHWNKLFSRCLRV
jgi:RNA recognition motif-containing protein